jgi:hypothetical protein
MPITDFDNTLTVDEYCDRTSLYYDNVDADVRMNIKTINDMWLNAVCEEYIDMDSSFDNYENFQRFDGIHLSTHL